MSRIEKSTEKDPAAFQTLLSEKKTKTEEDAPLTAKTTNGSRETPKPEPGTVWRVRVSGMSSLKYFYVQNAIDHEYLRTTVGPALEAAPADPPRTTPPRAGQMCAARCADGSWRRAKVKCRIGGGDNGAGQLYVRFVDFAADQEETVTEYKALPRDLAGDAPAARCCYLKNLPKDVETEPRDPNVMRVLKRYFGAACFDATFHNRNEPYAVTLRSAAGGKDAIDTINELIWEGVSPAAADHGAIPDPIAAAHRETLDWIAERCRQIGCGFRVARFGPVSSSEHFYVETTRGNRVARNVRNEIDATAEWRAAPEPAVGQTLIARCDGRLYRARLAWTLERRPSDGDVGPPRFRCFLVDRGAFADCSEFYRADSEYLRTAPPSKIHCSLYASRLYADAVWRCVSQTFADEMATAVRRDGRCCDVLLVLREVGSPCAVELHVDGRPISDVIRPAPVRVLNVQKTSFATSRVFAARVNCPSSRKLSDALKNTKKFRPAEDPRPLGLYAAELAEGRFIRVKYVGDSSSSADANAELVYKVIGVDEPSRPRYAVNRLYELPKSVANVQTADVHCTLASDDRPDSRSSRCSADKFVELCDNGKATFQMVILKNDHVNGHLVRLFFKSKDVSTMIDGGSVAAADNRK